MSINQQKLVYPAALLYTFIIGFSFLFVKMTLTVTEPVHVLAQRFTVAFIVASIPIILRRISLRVTFKDILPLLPLSLFYPALFFSFQTFGLSYTTSSEAGIIQAAVPIFTALLASLYLKEGTTRLQKAALLLSVSGVIFIFVMNGVDLTSNNFVGNILILISALSFAGYAVLARKVVRRYQIFDLTYLMTAISFIVFTLMSLIKHLHDGTITAYFVPYTDSVFVISILYLGILSSLLTAILSNFTLSRLEASKMSVFTNLSTLITIVAGVLFLQETIYYYHIFGSILIIAGVLGTNFFGKKEKAPQT